MNVHGHDLDLPGLRALVGTTRQVVGLRQVVLGDGVERGVRAIEARTAGGIDITCLVDRALDVADASINGFPLAWRASTGYAGPWFYEPSPMGFQRTMGGGLFVTAGLDHVLFPVREAEPAYAYPLIGERDYPMHGRIAHTPARVVELREMLDEEPALLRIRAQAEQASLFGEHLELDRTVQTAIGDPLLTITDKVTNLGGTPGPHMMLYHVNLGFPLIAPGTQLFGSPRTSSQPAPATDPDERPFTPFGQPVPGRVEQVFAHQLEADTDGWVHAGVYNPSVSLAFGLSWRSSVLPHLLEWRVERAGVYALGLEPSTAGMGGRTGARETGTLRTLEPGDSVIYEIHYRGVAADSLEDARAAWGL
jgi:hypothetical protein